MYTQYGPLILKHKDPGNLFIKLLNKFIYNPGVIIYVNGMAHR